MTDYRRVVLRGTGVVGANLLVLMLLLVPVELIFGNWIRPLSLSDLNRFSIPVSTRFEFDVSDLYVGGPRNPIVSSRDQWGLRGDFGALGEIDVLTVGGSTTDQRYIDDLATWQAVAQRELQQAGWAVQIGNAGVDGQSTVGHLFNFQFWFPLLEGLHPQIVLFYTGANDVLRHARRDQFDARVDARSWRFRSATFQLYRTVRDNIRARDVRVWHGRMQPHTDDDFTTTGLLDTATQGEIATQLTKRFITNIDELRRLTQATGATPVFVTQTAFAWNADHRAPRGLREVVTVFGTPMNYADVAYLHQSANRELMSYCTNQRLTCFDLASEVSFGVGDYYDYLHNSPAGTEKIGKYLAQKLAASGLLRSTGQE